MSFSGNSLSDFVSALNSVVGSYNLLGQFRANPVQEKAVEETSKIMDSVIRNMQKSNPQTFDGLDALWKNFKEEASVISKKNQGSNGCEKVQRMAMAFLKTVDDLKRSSSPRTEETQETEDSDLSVDSNIRSSSNPVSGSRTLIMYLEQLVNQNTEELNQELVNGVVDTIFVDIMKAPKESRGELTTELLQALGVDRISECNNSKLKELLVKCLSQLVKLDPKQIQLDESGKQKAVLQVLMGLVWGLKDRGDFKNADQISRGLDKAIGALPRGDGKALCEELKIPYKHRKFSI